MSKRESLPMDFLNHAARSGLFFLSCLAAVACTPALTAAPTATVVPTQAAPQIGDMRTRPADRADMLFVPAGEFSMGSDRYMAQYARRLCAEFTGELTVAACGAAAFRNEQPAHRVRLEAFWIDRTEVSNGQYRACVEAGACDPPLKDPSFTHAGHYGDAAYSDHPVINMDWQMAARYCAWAGARLPTEAEWEYAARGPEARLFPWGNDFDRSRLNYCDASCPLISDEAYDDGYPYTAPVGSFPAGASWVGALDMAGNVREWVGGWYANYPSADTVNPDGPPTGELRMTRGGAWYDTPDDIRSANRGSELPEYFRDNLGFRCAQGVE